MDLQSSHSFHKLVNLPVTRAFRDVVEVQHQVCLLRLKEGHTVRVDVTTDGLVTVKRPHVNPARHPTSKVFFIFFFLDILIVKIFLYMIKINNFRGDLSDISAVKTSLHPTSDFMSADTSVRSPRECRRCIMIRWVHLSPTKSPRY